MQLLNLAMLLCETNLLLKICLALVPQLDDVSLDRSNSLSLLLLLLKARLLGQKFVYQLLRLFQLVLQELTCSLDLKDLGLCCI